MSTRSIRYRNSESNNIWPGFVDVLATLLIVIIFILMVFTVSQIYLSDAISGRDKALLDLRNQINELSKVLVIESEQKQKALKGLKDTQLNLKDTQTDLGNQKALSNNLQTDISQKESELFVQEQNILALSNQIKDLLYELRIIAKALETYEGDTIASLDSKGLGERINKALATRINQLNILNKELDESNNDLAQSEKNLKATIKNLDTVNLSLENSERNLKVKLNELEIINNSLGLVDADLFDQIAAIQKKNALLNSSKLETEKALDFIKKVNLELALKDEVLQDQIMQYQKITTDLLAINDSLGLKDASLLEQLGAIKLKNNKLSELNLNLIKKDNTIFSLRGKILELDKILNLSEEKQISQQKKIIDLNNSFSLLDSQKTLEAKNSKKTILEMKIRSNETLEQVTYLIDEIEVLKTEISILNKALESSESKLLTKELKIEVLGERLNKALTSKVFELQKYRSEFFGKLKEILGDREDIKIVGDRFIFESELLFDTASANLQSKGMDKLKQIGLTLKSTTNEIPSDIDWIIQVEGHTDKRPIKTLQYPSNWELSTARANSVLKVLLDLGFEPSRLSAAGYGEFYPIADGDELEILEQNRRIELKLTSR